MGSVGTPFTSKPEEARRFVFFAPQNRILSGIEIGLAEPATFFRMPILPTRTGADEKTQAYVVP
jgi:hypothetical protein